MRVVASRNARARPGPDHGLWHRALTPRQVQVLRLICRGYTNREIAARLGIATATVGTYRGRLMDLVGTRRAVGLIRAAVSLGIVGRNASRDRRSPGQSD